MRRCYSINVTSEIDSFVSAALEVHLEPMPAPNPHNITADMPNGTADPSTSFGSFQMKNGISRSSATSQLVSYGFMQDQKRPTLFMNHSTQQLSVEVEKTPLTPHTTEIVSVDKERIKLLALLPEHTERRKRCDEDGLDA